MALIRGIGPGDPNMRNEKLRGVFIDLGFKNVQSLISSGNILFESSSSNIPMLEKKIEAAFPIKLGFQRAVIIKSQSQLQKLIDADPYKGLEHGKSSYLLVTFFKKPLKMDWKFPYQPPDKPYKFLSYYDGVLFSTTDNSQISTTDLMGWLEKEFGKDITSRTWLTINRIYKKLSVH